MTGNTGFVFHEWIGLQLCRQFGVASLAYAHFRLGREALGDFAMAHAAIYLVDAMRPGLPLGRQRLMAIGTVFSGWNLLVRWPDDSCLGDRGLDGAERSEQNEQDRDEQMRAESIHGQSPEWNHAVSDRRWPPYRDADHISPYCDLPHAIGVKTTYRKRALFLRGKGERKAHTYDMGCYRQSSAAPAASEQNRMDTTVCSLREWHSIDWQT
jgi:hypothetical protein